VTVSHPVVTVGGDPLRVADVVRVADGASVELSAEAVARIAASRAVVDRFVSGDELIYGLNTGLGHQRDERVPVEVLRAYQQAIVRVHDGAFGPPLPTRVVRAAMLVRVAGIAEGGSGASIDVAQTLLAMLERKVHPIVAQIGSVGASDLMHLAAVALVATGLGGRAELDGEILAGPEALRRAGIAPLVMGPKDGLALISANGVSVGHAALVAARAGDVAELADLAMAFSLEAIGGNPSILEPAVAVAKPVPGQAASAATIRGFLTGSDRFRPGAAVSVQDALSFRVAPQVHGACREVIDFLVSAVEVELRSSDDNPFVSVAEGRLISNGNFHPMLMALAADSVRPALAHLGLLSDHRMGHVWGAVLSEPELSTPEGMTAAVEDGGGLMLRYAAAARYTELRAAAGPVTLDVPPLDLAVEDHATNAPYAVRRTDEALDLLEDVLAAEVLVAHGAQRRQRPPHVLGQGVVAAKEAVEACLTAVGRGAPSDLLHAAVRGALLTRILPAARAAVRGGAPAVVVEATPDARGAAAEASQDAAAG
jgi:histidine ammonia-lyase